MILADLTALMSELGRKHPELVADEKVRRYILLLVEAGRAWKMPPLPELSPVDFDET